jgi:hypothetical protein
VGVESVSGDEVRRRPFRVALSPARSLYMATRDAAGADRSDTPLPWCEAIRSYLTRDDYEVLAPLATSQMVFVPEAILPEATPPGLPLREELERIVAIADEHLARDIRAAVCPGPAGDWRAAERDPSRWIRRYVTALRRAWCGFEPVWRHAQDALAREVERIGVATARDAQLELLDGLLPGSGVEDDHWRVRGLGDLDCVLPETGLVVIPLVAGPRASMLHGYGGVLVEVGYPMATTPAGGPAAEPPGSLDALLGAQRARLLLALDRPASNARLAEVLHTVPSAVTYHVSALERAGLVHRERTGRQVVARRTPRGDALLALYS